MENYQLALIGGGIILYLLYKYGTSTYKFFEKKGVPFEKPLPFVGNFSEIVFKKSSLGDSVNRVYQKFKLHRAFGFFELRNPILAICDPQLIRQIGIKDFDNFVDHRKVIDKDIEPVFSRNLVNLSGNEWREMRSTISPAFTGSKMRLMFELITESANNMVNNLKTKYAKNHSEANPMSLEIKDVCYRYTNDVVATAAFGIKTDSFNEPNNEFFKMGKRFTNFGLLTSLRFFFVISFTKLAKFLNISVFTAEFMNFFKSIVLDTIKYREKNNVYRPDMLNLLMEAKKGQLTANAEDPKDNLDIHNSNEYHEPLHQKKQLTHLTLDDDSVVSQCITFFLAGFETSSTLMSFACHEICVNSDVQMKLIKEIDEANEVLEGKPLTYEVLQKMKYLDMVISESLRLWPPAIATDRSCNKDYTFTDYEGKNITVKKGEIVWIPIFGIHRDERYYSNPLKFDPERFSEENKDSFDPATYLPFGIGPRFCIGNRFALLETKALIFYMLSNFTFEPCEKTQIPLKLKKAGFQFTAENGFWIQLKPRNKNN